MEIHEDLISRYGRGYLCIYLQFDEFIIKKNENQHKFDHIDLYPKILR